MFVVGGIDPGLSGALAFVSGPNKAVVYDIPTMSIKGKNYIDGKPLNLLITSEQHLQILMIEEAWAYPGQGVASMFKFGTTYGQILTAVQIATPYYDFVAPSVWKKLAGLRSTGDQRKDKEVSRARAIARFPSLADQLKTKNSHNRAEALLLASVYHDKYVSEKKVIRRRLRNGKARTDRRTTHQRNAK